MYRFPYNKTLFFEKVALEAGFYSKKELSYYPEYTESAIEIMSKAEKEIIDITKILRKYNISEKYKSNKTLEEMTDLKVDAIDSKLYESYNKIFNYATDYNTNIKEYPEYSKIILYIAEIFHELINNKDIELPDSN